MEPARRQDRPLPGADAPSSPLVVPVAPERLVGVPKSGTVRSLRFQLVVIITLTVATVLGVSQWLDTSLSEHALERDIKDRAQRALEMVGAEWTAADGNPEETMATLVRGNREFDAFDMFAVDASGSQLAVTTRRDPAGIVLAAGDLQALRNGTHLVVPLPGADRWRITIPIHRAGAFAGAVRVDLSFAGAAGLKAHLRAIDTVFSLASIVGISLMLAIFLERRVGRPVMALVGSMRRAEEGALGVRVEPLGGAEFDFLARQFNRMLASIEDLTVGLEERVRQATRALAAKNEELQDVNAKLSRAQLEIGRSERLAALGQMAATLAHELGTPLNSVLGYTQLLLREQPSPEQRAKLVILESQVQRMIETMRSVLDRTRELRRGPVGLESLIAEVLTLVSPQLAGRELTVRSEVAAGLPSIPADAAGLRQVLLNLVTNAIDATGASGSIVVTAAPLADGGRPGRWVEIAVRDTGCGMAPEDIRRVCEPFYTTKAPGRGTGLGLSIVDHIVRAHGGQLIVESALSRGTTMRVRLPAEV